MLSLTSRGLIRLSVTHHSGPLTMRTPALLAIFTLSALLAGCGGPASTNFNVEGVAVKVLHPVSAAITTTSSDLTDDAEKHRGTRYSYKCEEGASKRECVIEVADSQLQVNGKGYGSVAKGNTVVIDGDTVKVNGTERGASPPPKAK
jgi:hypothetical protein